MVRDCNKENWWVHCCCSRVYQFGPWQRDSRAAYLLPFKIRFPYDLHKKIKSASTRLRTFKTQKGGTWETTWGKASHCWTASWNWKTNEIAGIGNWAAWGGSSHGSSCCSPWRNWCQQTGLVQAKWVGSLRKEVQSRARNLFKIGLIRRPLQRNRVCTFLVPSPNPTMQLSNNLLQLNFQTHTSISIHMVKFRPTSTSLSMSRENQVVEPMLGSLNHFHMTQTLRAPHFLTRLCKSSHGSAQSANTSKLTRLRPIWKNLGHSSQWRNIGLSQHSLTSTIGWRRGPRHMI